MRYADVPFSIAQIELDSFFDSVDIETISYKITKLVRVRSTDFRDNKTKIMVYAHYDLIGIESCTKTEIMVKGLKMWIDYAFSPQDISTRLEGPKTGKWIEIYLQPFSKKVVEKAIRECTKTDVFSLQLIARDGNDNYCLDNLDDFLNLSQENLIVRAKLVR